MKTKTLVIWVSIMGIIGIVFGIFYSIVGLDGLPVYEKLVPSDVYIPWSNGLYGSIFIAFSVLLFFVGRYAFQIKNKTLMRFLLYGIMSWLIIEGFYSFLYGVYFNVGVDIVLAVVLGLPFAVGLRSGNK